MRDPEFGGVIGPTWRESTPWWLPEPTAPPDAPNIVVIVLDDVGYAQLGCYGSDIDTPSLDRLAAGGVRLANFHTTALCSPTRACLLTGRNHHRNGMGRVADLAVGVDPVEQVGGDDVAAAAAADAVLHAVVLNRDAVGALRTVDGCRPGRRRRDHDRKQEREEERAAHRPSLAPLPSTHH